MYKFGLLFMVLLVFNACQNNKLSNDIILKRGIIPQPTEILASDDIATFENTIPLVVNNEALKPVARQLKGFLKGYDVSSEIFENKSQTPSIALNIVSQPNDEFGKEGYNLLVSNDVVEVSANTYAGVFNGVQSLYQLAQFENGRLKLQHCNILDNPLYKWRGLHLDVSRHFFTVEDIKKYIDQMARYKLNTFHWHLVDDQGWRIEIKKYPKLTEIGSQRSQTIVEKNFDPFVGDKTPYGGFYTQDQIKEVVAYAKDRNITIVPEIEMPGHSQAALSAYPEYGCTGVRPQVLTKWGITDTIYCPTEKTFEFLQDILTEVMDLFPSEFIHIGGDEAPKKHWEQSAFCQQLIKKEGLKDEHELQSYFVQRIERFLSSKGRRLIGWDEILEGGLAPGASVMSWRGEEGGIAAANAGHDVVLTPGFVMYFDHYQAEPENEPLAIGGFSDLKKVYNYNPMPDSIKADKRHHVIGVQANVWTEYMKTFDHVEYMVSPRILALSEIAWVKPENKNWNGFIDRLPHNFELMKHNGINFREPQPGELSKTDNDKLAK